MQVDRLMFGCALALYQKDERFKKFIERVLRWPLMLAAASFLVFGSGILAQHLQGYYLLPFGSTLENLAITYLIVYFIRRPVLWRQATEQQAVGSYRLDFLQPVLVARAIPYTTFERLPFQKVPVQLDLRV